MIWVTLKDRRTVVRLDAVVCLHAVDDWTTDIYLLGGHSVRTAEAVDPLQQRLAAAPKEQEQ